MLGDAASLMMMMAKGSSKQKVASARAFHYLVHYTKSLPGATRLSGSREDETFVKEFRRSQSAHSAKLFNALIMCVSTKNFD